MVCRRRNRHLVFSVLILGLGVSSLHAATRVACVGDSINFGAGITDRIHNSYPTHLGYLLGSDTKVANFGVSGSTLLKKGDKPYWKTSAYAQALEFQPNIVVIMLGTNDSKLFNWKYAGDFESDYTQLIRSFQKLSTRPRMILCVPPPAFTENRIRGSVILKEISPLVRKLAFDNHCEIVDLHTWLLDDRKLLPDGVHPNNFGAAKMARRVYQTIVLKTDRSFDVKDQLAKEKRIMANKADRFHGFEMLRFAIAGRNAIVVMPRVAAEGHPWVWRARFWGHQPQFDRAMLERGWHIAFIDVANMFGSPHAVRIWDAFYAELVGRCGLDKKPVLEGMSRGGLIIYNWAKANPSHVAGIYGDNPVCDARSWPGGKQAGHAGKHSPPEWQRCLKEYGITEEQARTFEGFPIDGLRPLAEAEVPLLNIVGMADTVVPPTENTYVLKQRYEAFGGSIEVIRKPGQNHHPHSLPNPQPIVDFALRATGRYVNFAAVAAPSVEFRGKSAGWGGGTWWNQLDKLNQIARNNPDLRIVFLGDSITQSWTGADNRLSRPDGKRTFDKYYGNCKAASFGLSGDRTEHLLYRIANGNFDFIHPKVVVVMIGVNNISKGFCGEDIAAGIEAVVAALRAKVPDSKIVLLGCFPTGAKPDSNRRRQTDIIHQRIRYLGDEQKVYYRDLRKLFLNKDGTINHQRMRGDNIHLNGPGYDAWAKAMEPVIKLLSGCSSEKK